MGTHRTRDLALALFFVVLLCLPATLAIVDASSGNTIEAREQRQRGPWPALPESLRQLRAWPGQLQRWFDDRFGLRGALISLHNAAKALMGVSPDPMAVIGREGWLFIDQSLLVAANRGALPFAEGEAERLVDLFLDFQNRLEASGIAFLQLTPPDKQSLYPEFLPARIRRVGPSRYERWRRLASSSALNFVDVFPALEAAKAAVEYPYMQTDSHWNCGGAFVAYEQLMARLRRHWEGPLRILTRQDVDFERRRYATGRDLARNVIGVPGLFPETRAMSCNVGTATKARFSDLLSGDPLTRQQLNIAPRRSRVVNEDFPEGPRVLVLRDSYTNAMIDYLNGSFGEVIYMHRDTGLPGPRQIADLAPDIVIYEHVERSLVGLRRSLRKADSPPDG